MPKEDNTILICNKCEGSGKFGSHKCNTCNGYGTGVVMGEYFLYWDGVFSINDVIFRKLKRVIDKIIDGLLILLSIFGFLNLVYYAYKTGFIKIVTKDFWLTPNIHMLQFFVFLFGFLYFSYRSTIIIRQFVKPLKFAFNQSPTLKKVVGWDGIKKFKHKDISKSFSPSSNNAIENAFFIAKKYKTNLTIEQLFLSLLKQAKVKIIFGRLGIPIKILEDKVSRNIGEGTEKNITFTKEVLNVLFTSYARAVLDNAIKTEVNLLLLEIVKNSKFLTEVLYDLNINDEKLTNVVSWITVQDRLYDRWTEFRKASLLRPRGDVNRAMTSVQTPILNHFSDDLTRLARRGIINLCIGREDVFEQIFRIIEGGGKGVVLVGESGIGKSAIIDGLAERMTKEDVPSKLKDNRLVRLYLSELLGGATNEGAGNNIMAVINDVRRSGNIVLDIPNLEFFKTGGHMALSALLAEELSKIGIPVLASTTPEGYRDVIEGTALADVFEKVEVLEPDINLAIQILESESAEIEYRENVFFSYDALESAVKLSSRYIKEKNLPESALEVIKETASEVAKNHGKNSIIGLEDIAKIISQKSKVPITSLSEGQRDKLLKLEQVIHSRVIGQEEAVDAVSRALRRASSGIHEGKRPIANFLFMGPTGVGKTELAKTIAEVYFGSEDTMIRLDMSEYQNQASIARMIGSAGGRGYLTEAVIKKPSALILLDELEKAHPDILNLFLQVMDDGRLTDGRSKTVDFTNTIIVATSNAGSTFIANEISNNKKVADFKDFLIKDELSKYFRPEFLNRFDGLIVFRPLTEDEIVKIANLLINNLAKKIEKKGIELIVSDNALKELAKIGFDPKFGARPLKRVITREIEDKLANMLLGGELDRRDSVIFHSLDDVEVKKAQNI